MEVAGNEKLWEMKLQKENKDGGTQLNIDELGNKSELINEIFNEFESLEVRQHKASWKAETRKHEL